MMPMFTVERSYLVPVYQHITVEADDVATATGMPFGGQYPSR